MLVYKTTPPNHTYAHAHTFPSALEYKGQNGLPGSGVRGELPLIVAVLALSPLCHLQESCHCEQQGWEEGGGLVLEPLTLYIVITGTHRKQGVGSSPGRL